MSTIYTDWGTEEQLLAMGYDRFRAFCLSRGVSSMEALLIWKKLKAGKSPLGLSREDESKRAPLELGGDEDRDREAVKTAGQVLEWLRGQPEGLERDKKIRDIEEAEAFFAGRVRQRAASRADKILRRVEGLEA